MYHSSNYIVRTVFNNALYNSNSCIGYKMAYFRNTYAVDITKHDPTFVCSRVNPIRSGLFQTTNDPGGPPYKKEDYFLCPKSMPHKGYLNWRSLDYFLIRDFFSVN